MALIPLVDPTSMDLEFLSLCKVKDDKQPLELFMLAAVESNIKTFATVTLRKFEKKFGGGNADRIIFLSFAVYEIFTCILAQSTQATAITQQTIDNLSCSDVFICASLQGNPKCPQLDNEVLATINPDDLKGLDLIYRSGTLGWQWLYAVMLTIGQKGGFLKNTRRKLTVNGMKPIGFDSSPRVECYTATKRGRFGMECRAPTTRENRKYREVRGESQRRGFFLCSGDNYLPMLLISCVVFGSRIGVDQEEERRKLELAQKQKDKIQLTVENFENSSKNLSKLLDCQIVDKCKTSLGYHVVPPHYTGNFMPLKPDLSFSGLEDFVNEPIVSEPIVKKPVVETNEAKSSADKPKAVKKNNGSPIIED
ncbi:hypothetical protein Tco_0013157 [Tanacetum coccineum]